MPGQSCEQPARPARHSLEKPRATARSLKGTPNGNLLEVLSGASERPELNLNAPIWPKAAQRDARFHCDGEYAASRAYM